MQIVIDIDENDYELIKEYGITTFPTVGKAIANGTPFEQIRDEIEQARFIDKNTKICKNALASGLEAALRIIDKYKGDKG